MVRGIFFRKNSLFFVLVIIIFSFFPVPFLINNDGYDYLAATINSISLNKKVLNLQLGKEDKLTYKIGSDNASSQVLWVSNNKNVATVDSNGNVKAVEWEMHLL